MVRGFLSVAGVKFRKGGRGEERKGIEAKKGVRTEAHGT